MCLDLHEMYGPTAIPDRRRVTYVEDSSTTRIKVDRIKLVCSTIRLRHLSVEAIRKFFHRRNVASCPIAAWRVHRFSVAFVETNIPKCLVDRKDQPFLVRIMAVWSDSIFKRRPLKVIHTENKREEEQEPRKPISLHTKGLCRRFRSDQHFVGDRFGDEADGE
jgi:hypothetical protein